MTEKTIDPARKLFFGLFIFPLVIAVGMAVLLCGVVLLTNEKETPETLISAIKAGSPSKRWQKAFELSNELNRNRSKNIRDGAVQSEILYILKDAQTYDAKTRSYMAMALTHFPGPDSVSALRTVLEEDSQEIRIAALWSLGSLGAAEAASDVKDLLGSDQAELRKVSAYVLGVFGDKKEVPAIRPLLNDPVSDVKWNAALALARMGDGSGLPVLEEMTRREALAAAGLEEPQIEAVMINALKGLALIQAPESIKIFESLSRADKNMKVRQAAIDAIKLLKKN